MVQYHYTTNQYATVREVPPPLFVHLFVSGWDHPIKINSKDKIKIMITPIPPPKKTYSILPKNLTHDKSCPLPLE